MYDSMFTGRNSESLDLQLAMLYAKRTTQLRLTIASMQQQRGGSDCGLFALAVVTAIAFGKDPSILFWRQCNMRGHLVECFRTERITQFPTIETKDLQSKMTRNLETDYFVKLYCLCKLPKFVSKQMVQCQSCSNWFHKPCVEYLDVRGKIDSFFCDLCSM